MGSRVSFINLRHPTRCYVLRPFAPATSCQISPNHRSVELLIYGYSSKHTMRETKGLGEDIHFRLGLSGDTTEKKHNTERTRKFPSKQFRSKGQHMETKPVSQRPIIKAKPRVSRYHKKQCNVYF